MKEIIDRIPASYRPFVFLGTFFLAMSAINFICTNSRLNESLNGTVVNKYRDTTNHNAARIIYANGRRQYITETIDNDHLFDVINVGDYIIKNSGSPDYVLIKKNSPDTLVFKCY